MKLIQNLPIQVNGLISFALLENTQTLSFLDPYQKLIGLAGLRIGYAVSNPEIADLLKSCSSAI